LFWTLTIALALAADASPSDAAAEPPAPAEGVADAAYKIDAGDVLQVLVYGEEDLSGPLVVGEHGAVRVPLVGDVPVAGMTADQAAAALQQRLADGFLKDPHVGVRVSEYASRPVRVLGAVEKPGLYYLRGATSLLEMLAISGDVDSEAGQVKEVHVRREGSTQVVDLQALVATGQGDVLLQAGDVVYVPEGRVVYVSGQVEEPGEVAFAEGLTVTRALANAGGATPTASLREAWILRDGEKIPVKLRRILQGREPDVELKPGDQLIIAESVL
jgi:polysaccharide export outer membrane protein